jgi:hypothetical protein
MFDPLVESGTIIEEHLEDPQGNITIISIIDVGLDEPPEMAEFFDPR